MAKINATYGSGVYLSPDFDYRKLQEQRKKEKRPRRHGDDDGGDDEKDGGEVKRQTFAMPFDLICGLCHRRVVRGSHVYVNRRATKEKYLGSIRIWELEFHCKFCDGLLYLVTDPETPKLTGGYKCAKNCERTKGDLLDLNRKNEEMRHQWEKDKAETENNPLEAMERENEAARKLAELNRGIEEDVDAREAQEDRTHDLLRSVRARRAQQQQQQQEQREEWKGSGGSRSFLSSLTHYTPGVYATDVTGDDEEAYDAFTKTLPAPQPDDHTQSHHSTSADDDDDDDDVESESTTSSSNNDEADDDGTLTGGPAKATSEADQLARALGRYGDTDGDFSRLMSVPLAPSSSAETAPGRSTGPSQEAEDPATSQRRNVFLLADDDDDDDDDEEVLHPTKSMPPPRTAARKPTGSLLSRLADSDDDDDE